MQNFKSLCRINDIIKYKERKIKKRSKCRFNECDNTSKYNHKVQTVGALCTEHKKPFMIDVTRDLCINKECYTRAVYNNENEKKGKYCYLHKSDVMVDVINKSCKTERCKVRPSFNYKGMTNGLYCELHKLTDMVDVINLSKECQENNCTKRAHFNYIYESKALYCKEHSKNNMIDIISKRCKKDGCMLFPTYNFENKKGSIYCNEHKLDGMVNAKDNRCETELCDTIASKKHLKGYCLRCFIYNFPNDKIVRDYGTREAKVSQFIKETYTDLKITYNKIIDGGCSKNRPDIFIDCLTHSIIIEVDEHQHKQKVYTPECEISRINNLFTDLADRPIVFIRFNPDSYTNKNNKLIKSCFEYTEDKGLPKANKTLQTRLNKLKKLIDVNLNKVPTENITMIKLYYDGF